MWSYIDGESEVTELSKDNKVPYIRQTVGEFIPASAVAQLGLWWMTSTNGAA